MKNVDAQLAEKKLVALQHRSRAKSSQVNSLFESGTLNECKSKTQHEFSERDKQSI